LALYSVNGSSFLPTSVSCSFFVEETSSFPSYAVPTTLSLASFTFSLTLSARPVIVIALSYKVLMTYIRYICRSSSVYSYYDKKYRADATQINSIYKIIQVNNHCLIIITENSTNYGHVMMAVLVDLYQVFIQVNIEEVMLMDKQLFDKAAVFKY
jgi:hypothetical protein